MFNNPLNHLDWLGLDSFLLYNCDDEGYGPGSATGKDATESAGIMLINQQYNYIVPFRTPEEAIKRLGVVKSMGIKITSIGILDHGAPGYQEFGPHGIDFMPYAKSVGSLMEKNGSICMYGCSAASGKVGSVYLDNLSYASGESVYGFTGSQKTTSSGVKPGLLSFQKCSKPKN